MRQFVVRKQFQGVVHDIKLCFSTPNLIIRLHWPLKMAHSCSYITHISSYESASYFLSLMLCTKLSASKSVRIIASFITWGLEVSIFFFLPFLSFFSRVEFLATKEKGQGHFIWLRFQWFPQLFLTLENSAVNKSGNRFPMRPSV